ncbi:hypothetical protein OEZ85_009829 [Tetradesmus obliquus]|uniref:Uncharacterized protein n=1 Tax=Tetradesmus obliquus TaxID=3088 RepID=A0ABY8UAZ1_TETOB|nr:hypothetical protein OEZ85_009829 [Tetradesmus obliquus]
MNSTGPCPSKHFKTFHQERFGGLAQCLLQGIEAGVVVCLQAIPYGMDCSKPSGMQALKKLQSYYIKLGKQGRPHPGHERLFDLLKQRVEASTPQQQQQQPDQGPRGRQLAPFLCWAAASSTGSQKASSRTSLQQLLPHRIWMAYAG